MHGLKQDLGYALRQLSRHRGHAAAVVLALGLGSGANTAVFSLVDAVLLRPLPVRDPSSLVLFRWSSGPSPSVEYLTGEWWREAGSGRVTASSFSYPAFEAFQDRSTTLAATFAWAELRRASLSVDGEAELATGQLVSGGYYSGLGVRSILGRAIAPEDDRAGAELVAVISHAYWQRRFGGAPDVIGRSATLDGRPLTIVGISPRGFSGTLPLGRSADVSLPLRAWHGPAEPYLSNPAWHWLQVMGRRRATAASLRAPALRATRVDLTLDLHAGARAGGSHGFGRTLVVAQVALSLVLLAGAGLFLRTLRNLTGIETGIADEGVHLFKVHAVASGGAGSLDLSRRLFERFQGLPGVVAVGVSAHQLVGDTSDRTRVTIEGRRSGPGGDEFVHVNRVGGDFFDALGIPMRAGRAIGPRDGQGARIPSGGA
jgi:MacB-like periplasmic core domain